MQLQCGRGRDFQSTGVTYPLGLDPGADIFAKYAERNAGITRNVLIDMDCKMTDIIAIISSIIAIGYSIYSIITKSYIRQYNLEKFEHFSLNQKKVCIVFNFIMTLIIGISGVYILLLYLF